MERINKSSETDLTQVYKRIKELDSRVDILYYLKHYGIDINTTIYYINELTEVYDPLPLILIDESYDTAFFVNINKRFDLFPSIWTEHNHNTKLVFINCIFENLRINYIPSEYIFINTIILNKLHIDSLYNNINYWPDNLKQLTIQEPRNLNLTFDLLHANLLEEFKVYQVNGRDDTYECNIILPGSIKKVNINMWSFNIQLHIDTPKTKHYLEEMNIYCNYFSQLTCLIPIDLTQTYDSSLFNIDFNKSYNNIIENVTLNPTVLCCFKSDMRKWGLGFNSMNIIDLFNEHTTTTFINSSWNASIDPSINWIILKLNNNSCLFTSLANFKQFFTTYLNTNLTVTPSRYYGL